MNKTLVLSLALALPLAANAAGAGAGKDTEFRTKAAQGGMAEVALGQLAVNKASDPKVKEFGQRMVDDHGKANEELKSIAQRDGESLPSESSKGQQDMAQKLGQKSGKDFDAAYAQMMVKDHEEDVALFKKEASSGQDPEMKQFASKTLPTLEEHLKMAKALPEAGKGSAKKE